MATNGNGDLEVREHTADRGYAAEPMYLTDLGRCAPADRLSADPKRHRWRTLSYETDTLSGVMLLAGPETAAPNLTYPLRASGWHSVSIGVYGDTSTGLGLLARLSEDETFSILTLRPGEQGRHREELRELFWKVADLTGQDLVFGQIAMRVAAGDGPGAFQCWNAGIAYIKLVALSDAEVSELRADRRRTDTRRLFAHDDAHGPHFNFRPTTAEDIRRHIEPYRDTDFSRIYWEAALGDRLQYFSDIGPVPAYDGLEDYGRLGDRMQAESWRIFRDKGIDPFQVALEHAHLVGLEFHAGLRVAGFYFPPPLDHYNHGLSFYKYHPELRGMDRQGRRTPRMSYAYPEVRRFVVSLLREVAGYPIDGIGIWYNRRPPVLEYEPPLSEGFKAEYGEDPTELDPKDSRWLAYRARTLTQFMREVRGAMDDEAEKQGRERIEVSAIVMGSEADNLYYGMDLRGWIDEGVVDTLIPYTSAPALDSGAESWTDVRDAEYFVALTKGTSCRLALSILPRQMSPEDYRRKAAALYEVGVDYLFFWDSDASNRAHYGNDWSGLRRLGHRDEIEAWTRAGEPSLATPTLALRKLGDWDLSYVTPG